MAVTAVNPRLFRMNGVGEWYGLDGLVAHPGVLGRAIVSDTSRAGATCQHEGDSNQKRQLVGPLRENRLHLRNTRLSVKFCPSLRKHWAKCLAVGPLVCKKSL